MVTFLPFGGWGCKDKNKTIIVTSQRRLLCGHQYQQLYSRVNSQCGGETLEASWQLCLDPENASQDAWLM